MSKEYDLIVIGSGGGTKLGRSVARLGKTVAFIDKGPLGGTCLNRGCIPSKMLIHAADVMTQIRQAKRFFIHIPDPVEIDYKSLSERVNKEIDEEAASISPYYEEQENLDYFPHEARFIDKKTFMVNGREITSDKIILATGARPYIPNIPGLKGTPYWSSTEALRNSKLPKSLIVIGGGYISTELGYLYAALGVKTDFIVRDCMIRHEDGEVRKEFEKAFQKQFPVHMGLNPIQVKHNGSFFTVHCESAEGHEKLFQAEALLLTTGVVPNSDQLALEHTEIKTNSKGFILVNEYMQSTQKGIWAIGDCVGKYMFRHSVNFEGEYLFRTLYEKPCDEPINYPPMPHAIFTHPQVAGVGKTEEELKEEGRKYSKGINSYAKSAMGMALRSELGFAKVLFDKETRKLVGAHIIGDEASNMIHMAVAYLNMGATIDDMMQTIYIHPALPEILRNAVRNACHAWHEADEELF